MVVVVVQKVIILTTKKVTNNRINTHHIAKITLVNRISSYNISKISYCHLNFKVLILNQDSLTNDPNHNTGPNLIVIVNCEELLIKKIGTTQVNVTTKIWNQNVDFYRNFYELVFD